MAAQSTVTSERAPVGAEVIQTLPQSTYTKYKCHEATVCPIVSQQEGRDSRGKENQMWSNSYDTEGSQRKSL